ncbi:porin family protein [Parashewanella curva]|uniref:Porin family protein n=1 Tax=Parashewanella curva TaxID=2338552 RepID=A0A3L8PVP6_9GAMM|nr:outer membrane beta-barrel protein [Parashewanella curva]RLV59394.1 porin family protein [Parashewanella curva]
MMKKTLLAIILAGFSTTAMAQWGAGVHYIGIMSNDSGPDVSLNGIQGSLSYRFDVGEGFDIIPELRYATGVGEDDVSVPSPIPGQVQTIDIELEAAFGLAVRAQYEWDNGFIIYGEPTYTRIDSKGTTSILGNNLSVDSDDWKLGIGAGVGYRLTDSLVVDFSYNRSNDVDIANIGLRFDF